MPIHTTRSSTTLHLLVLQSPRIPLSKAHEHHKPQSKPHNTTQHDHPRQPSIAQPAAADDDNQPKKPQPQLAIIYSLILFNSHSKTIRTCSKNSTSATMTKRPRRGTQVSIYSYTTDITDYNRAMVQPLGGQRQRVGTESCRSGRHLVRYYAARTCTCLTISRLPVRDKMLLISTITSFVILQLVFLYCV